MYPKRRGRRPLAVLATLSLVAGLFLASGTVLAVHDETFQLDGDVSASTVTHVPAGSTQTLDWDSIFTAAGAPVATLPTGYEDAAFKRDFKTATNGTFITSDNSTYATGSKDTLPISGWQCNQDNNVNSKIDVMNAYTVAYTNPAGDDLIYFALERNTNTGTADVGFWFLQSEVGCESTGSAVTFSGAHTDGDVLVVSEFSNGGTVSTINVYRWDGGANGSLNPTPVGSGVDCRDPNLILPDSACAASNKVTNGTSGTITTPWLTSNFKDKVGHSLRTSEFFEGGINLTDLNLGGKCFSTFLGDTRSSTSLTATLFDFAGGTVGECGSDIVTTPQSGSGGAIPATIGTNARVDVRDHAAITVTGSDADFAGSVKFFLCGPLALNSTTNCATGGVQIGSPLTGEPVVGTNGSATVDSDTATLTSAGRYCWRAEYSGDASVGIPGSSDPENTTPPDTSVSECFSIGPVQPTLTTMAGADVILGNPITDSASLTGTAKQPGTDGVGPGGTINATAPTQAAAGGSITWTVKGPDDCDASGLAVTGTPATVAGDGSYGPVSATPAVIGVYTFVASYNGSSPNTLGAGPSSCPPSATDGDEEVTVGGSSSVATTQDWLPNDTATLTGDTNLNGTLTFQLYTGNNCGVTSGDVVANQFYSVDVNDAATGSTFSTNNTTSFVEANSGTYSWKVTYDDDNLADPAAPTCETTTITIDDTP
jgi:hypothetical protein